MQVRPIIASVPSDASSPAARSRSPLSHPPTAIATVLTPAERPRVDAAGEGLYQAIHRDTVDDVIRDLRERRAGAVLVSVSRCCDARATARMATVVREFPRVPAIALLTQFESDTARAVLALGRCGISQLVDVRQSTGWRELRAALGDQRARHLRSPPLSRRA
jgi:hypothetical protein